LFFNKKPTVEEIIEKQVENLIGYAYTFAMAYHKWLSKQYEDFGEITNDYSFAFMELFTIAACGMSLHSPSLAFNNKKTYALKSFEKHLPMYFTTKDESLYPVLVHYNDFVKEMLVPCTNDGFNFSDVTGIWLLQNLQLYDNCLEQRDLIRILGNEITNHFIYLFEETWEPLQLEAKHFM
jgi:hypothetical protein